MRQLQPLPISQQHHRVIARDIAAVLRPRGNLVQIGYGAAPTGLGHGLRAACGKERSKRQRANRLQFHVSSPLYRSGASFGEILRILKTRYA